MPSEPISLTVDTFGPFFTSDPKKTLYRNIGDMLDKLADWMEDEVRGDIASHAGQMPRYSGWTWAHTKGYRNSPKTGKHWALWAAVATVTAGMSTPDAIRTKAAMAGRHRPSPKKNNGVAAGIEERWHPYRRVKSGVYRSRPILSADLTRNMN